LKLNCKNFNDLPQENDAINVVYKSWVRQGKDI